MHIIVSQFTVQIIKLLHISVITGPSLGRILIGVVKKLLNNILICRTSLFFKILLEVKCVILCILWLKLWEVYYTEQNEQYKISSLKSNI